MTKVFSVSESWHCHCIASYLDSRVSGEGFVSDGMMRRWLAGCLLGIMAGTIIIHPLPLWAQHEEITRKVKSRVQPVYPEIARRMNIAGTVRVQVVVAPNGNVKSTKLVGGHPLLANAAIDALKKWRFESGAEDTTGVVEFKFETPQQ